MSSPVWSLCPSCRMTSTETRNGRHYCGHCGADKTPQHAARLQSAALMPITPPERPARLRRPAEPEEAPISTWSRPLAEILAERAEQDY